VIAAGHHGVTDDPRHFFAEILLRDVCRTLNRLAVAAGSFFIAVGARFTVITGVTVVALAGNLSLRLYTGAVTATGIRKTFLTTGVFKIVRISDFHLSREIK
jgi:hypothetical protein